MAYMKQPIATESVCHGKLQTKWGIRALRAEQRDAAVREPVAYVRVSPDLCQH